MFVSLSILAFVLHLSLLQQSLCSQQQNNRKNVIINKINDQQLFCSSFSFSFSFLYHKWGDAYYSFVCLLALHVKKRFLAQIPSHTNHMFCILLFFVVCLFCVVCILVASSPTNALTRSSALLLFVKIFFRFNPFPSAISVTATWSTWGHVANLFCGWFLKSFLENGVLKLLKF